MSLERTAPVVLTIDDEAVIRSSLKAYLEDYDFQVLEAENGKIGLELIDSHPIDLVLVDLRMPEMDGLAVLKTVQSKYKDLPVIVVSGTGNIGDVVEALRLGAWDYLFKPIDDMSMMLHTVEKNLERSRLILENKNYQRALEKNVEQKTEELACLNQRLRDVVETTKFLLDGKELDEYGVKLLEEYVRHMQASGGVLYKVTNDGLSQIAAISKTVADEFIPFPLPDTVILAKVLAEKEVCCVSEKVSARVAMGLDDASSNPFCLVFPIMTFGKNVRAIVGLYRRKEGEYIDQDIEIGAIISSYAGGALEAASAREALRKSEEFLMQAQKMEAIGTLAGGIAHDFNNILSAIVGYTDLSLFNDKCDGIIRKNLVQVKKASERARDLVRQILAFSRMDPSQESAMNISPIIKEALKLLRATIPSSIEVKRSIPDNIGKVTIDPTRVHQIIMNLCTNAIHAMKNEEGVLMVSYECRKREDIPHNISDIEGEKFLCLTVGDTGAGMDEETVAKIFDPYFTTKQKEQGTGLGLTVVHGIVRGCGGQIKVESELGHGTSFYVYLPCGDDIEGQVDAEKPIRLARGSETILFVDDEVTLAEMAREMLESLGYTVHIMTNSTDALEALRRNSSVYDLLITDQTMPVISGVELARKTLEIRADIPVILYTGYSAAVDGNEARKIGIKEFMMKPLSMTNLSMVVRKVLNEASGEE